MREHWFRYGLDDLFFPIHRLVFVSLVASLIVGCAGTSDGLVERIAKPVARKADPQLLELADKAIQQSRYGDASKILERILIFEPTNNKAQLLMGEVTLATGNPEKAVRQFETLAKKRPSNARALQGLGLSLMRLGQRKKAHDALEKAVELDAKLWRSWNALAYLNDLLGKWDKSAFAYAQAIKQEPDAAIIYNNRGFSRLLQKKLDLAIEDLHRAIGLDPKLEVARRNLLFALAWKGEYRRAMLGIEKGKRGEALNNIGFVALLRGDLKAAEAYFLRALEADAAYNAVAYKNLAYVQALKKIPDSEIQKKKN